MGRSPLTLVLSLFPGIGLLDRAFEEEGFCLVRGPDLLWGGDVKRFHPPPGRFDGVIGGPPCQAHSRMANIVRAKGLKTKPDLIPEFERCVREAQPAWFVMENVPAAPEPRVAGYHVVAQLLNNRWLGEVQNRLRRFSFGFRERALPIRFDVAALESAHFEPAVMALGTRLVDVKVGGSGKLKRGRAAIRIPRSFAACLELQGLPPDFLSEAPFTMTGKRAAVGNGVPLPMGRAVARAVKAALDGIGKPRRFTDTRVSEA